MESLVIFPIGISGCGKTAYSKKLKQKLNLEVMDYYDFKIKVRDEHPHIETSEVEKMFLKKFEEYLTDNKSVYLDMPNLTEESRKKYLELVKKYNKRCIAVVFCTSYRKDICQHRVQFDLENKIRERNTLELIDDQHKCFLNQMRHMAEFRKEIENYCSEYKITSLECDPD